MNEKKSSVSMAIEVLDAELQTEQLECVFNALDDSSDRLYELLGELVEKRKGRQNKISDTPINITDILHHFEVETATKKDIGSDISYRQIVKSVKEAERFNYASDYWGSAEEYQERNVELMEAVEDYIGELVSVKFDGEEDNVIFKLIGVLIDKKYNSLSHTVLLVEEIEEDNK